MPAGLFIYHGTPFCLFFCLSVSPSITCTSRDATSLIVTQCVGLPPLYPHHTIPLSAYYALNIFYHAQKSAPFILCPQRTRRPVSIAFSHTLMLFLCSSGDVEVNPGPACPQALSLVDFCNRKSLGFMLTSEASSLSLFTHCFRTLHQP